VDGDADILAAVRAAFADCPRPEHFADPAHCMECADHDELLQARTPDTLRLEDVDNPCWDPICYVEAAGFAYLFPGLARLALADTSVGYPWYPSQLLFHLTYDGKKNRRILSLTREQRRAVADLLRHLALTRADRIDEFGPKLADEILSAIEMWSGEPGV
jgi:hypothetical protein